jgi:hypothetical protein
MRPTRSLIPVLLFVASTAHAVTYIVPADREMIQQSDDIVVATGVTSLVEDIRGAIVTRYTLRIEEVLKGPRAVGGHLVLTERGGLLGDRITYIPGTPRYAPGERYLIFTEANRDGDPVTFGMSLGQFVFVARDGRTLSLRGELEGFDRNLERHVEQARDAALFLAYIRGIVAQRIAPEPRYFVDVTDARARVMSEATIAAEASRGSYLMTDPETGRAFRWSNPSATFVKAGAAVGANGSTAVTLAFSQWNGTNSAIDYKDGGQDDTATGGISNDGDTRDGKNAILFNDPKNQIVSTAVAGLGGITVGGNPYSLGGEEFWDMLEVDVVMNNISLSQSCYDTVMTHELGHTLGFRHSNQNGTNDSACVAPAVCTTNAIMNSAVQCSWKGILKDYDSIAAETVYGNGVACTPAAIVDQPASATIRAGTTLTLNVTATGTEPRHYQWYEGAKGDFANPVGTDRPVFVSPSPISVPTAYWVHVSNNCGSADSDTAIINLLPPQQRRRAVGHP